MAFSSGFMTGLRAREMRDERLRKKAIEQGLADIENAKPEQLQGFTAQDGAQLEQAAASGQYDIGTKTNDDGSFAGYTVTPKADPSQVGVIAARGVTDFLGNRTEGQLTERQTDRARLTAQAGVLAKNGDVLGAQRLRRDAQQAERDDLRFDREQKDWADKDDEKAKTKAYERERGEVMASLKFSQITSGHNQAMKDFVEAQKQYEADKAAGKPVGVAPTPPARGEYTLADRLADHGRLLEVGAKYGKVDDKSLMEFANTYQTLQKEGYGRALQIAQAGGTAEQVAAAFSESGSIKLDAKDITIKDAPAKKGEPASKLIQFKDGQGRMRTIATLPELEAMGQADKIYTRFFQSRADQRGENADARGAAAEGRAAGRDRREQEEKKAEQEARVAIFKEENPNATEAQLAAVRQGVLPAVPKETKVSTKFNPNGSGAGGTLTQTDNKGNATVTTIGMDGKPKGQPLQIPAPGKAAAPKPPGKPPGKPTKGQEQVIQAGPNKGKTAVYDGNGWVLKP